MRQNPGVYPPVVIKGKLHLDGGIMNNLPVDVMKKLMGQSGIVIASKLSANEDQKKHTISLLF